MDNETNRARRSGGYSRRGMAPAAEVYDALTGLPGRKAGFAMLARTITLARRIEQGVLAVLVDLDRFYIVNETKGTAFGDEALRRIAKRLKKLRHAKAHRLSGNTFLLYSLVSKDIGRDEMIGLVQTMKSSVEECLPVRGEALYPFSSIGVSRYPEDGDTAELVLRHADTALRQAKAAGGNRIEAYAEDEVAEINRVEALRVALRGALPGNQLRVHYQPLYQTSGTLRGFEALLRWRHPELGDVSPAEFIPIAEQSGQIERIGEWVLGEACRMLRRMQDRGMRQLIMSVNLSPLQLRAKGFADLLEKVVKQAAVEPACLELEITESVMIASDDHLDAIFDMMRRMGIRLALDDFGVGYASLNYLRALPLHTLKLDRSFIRHICEERAESIIVRTMISLVQQLGFEVVAEGVETEGQFLQLREWGCNYYQGYLMAPPMPEDAVGEHLMHSACDVFRTEWALA